MRSINYHPEPEALVWTFGGANAVLEVRPGTVMSIWSEDAFGGKIRGVEDTVATAVQPALFNPQSGPFYVSGAEPGDTLALHFVSITPARAFGVSAITQGFGALTSTRETATLQQSLPEVVWVYPIDLVRRTVTFAARYSGATLDLPLDPMLGTVGVAPALGEVKSSLVPGEFGGNMDVPEMRAGVTCYLGVNVPGALFSVGDGHCRQGQGEVCGAAVESAMETVLVVDLIKKCPTLWPRLEDDGYIMSVGCARPLEDAFRIAQADLVRWVAVEAGLDLLDSYQLVSQVTETEVANVVNSTYTIVAKLPKVYLESARVYGGLHSYMCEQSRIWRQLHAEATR